MASIPRISPYPVPSFTHWRFNYPRMEIHNQHRGVFYATVMAQYGQRMVLLEEKRRAVAAEAAFRSTREALMREQRAQHDDVARVLSSPEATRNAINHADLMNRHALHELCSPTIDALTLHGKLTSQHFARLLESLAAESVVDMIDATETRFDRAKSLKRAADWSGTGRARAASALLERAGSMLPGGATTQHFNGLMATYISCGFAEASRVHGVVYDLMGVRGVHPNATTYHRVMQSLCLTGNPHEAQSIFKYLKEHHASVLTVEMYETMMWGWLLEKDYQRCDELWLEIVMRSQPRPSIRLAEIYMRSILELARTPITNATTQFAQTNEVERKRIPGLLKQMSELGIPYTEMRPWLWEEARAALRKYAIGKREFYNFGRAAKQFDFLDHRRQVGMVSDITELSPVVRFADTPMQQNREDAVSLVGSVTIPSHAIARNSWETMPLQQILNHEEIEQVNARGPTKYREASKPIDERNPNWMSEVPETRYDRLYAVTNPKLHKMGIRRLLTGDNINREEILHRDKRVLARTLSVARRVRQSVERQRTHREE